MSLKNDYELLKKVNLHHSRSMLFWLQASPFEQREELVDAVEKLHSALKATDAVYSKHVYNFVRELPIDCELHKKDPNLFDRMIMKAMTFFGMESPEVPDVPDVPKVPSDYTDLSVDVLFKGNMFKEHLDSKYLITIHKQKALGAWEAASHGKRDEFVKKLNSLEGFRLDEVAKQLFINSALGDSKDLLSRGEDLIGRSLRPVPPSFETDFKSTTKKDGEE